MNFKNPIVIAIIVAGFCIGGAIIYTNQGRCPKASSGNILSPQEAAEKAISFINQNILQGMTASLLDTAEENEVFKIHFGIEDQEYDSYVTRNGKLLFVDAIDLDSTSEEEETTQDIPKRDRPDVKLFVMSYCPYGLQAQKMFLPVYDLLKDKADMGIYFVDYIMHEKDEIDENLNQYCIQKEQKEKFSNYLSCFVESGESEKCLSEANIDRGKLIACISSTDEEYNITAQYNDQNTWVNARFPKFDIHSDLNEQYGVQGSPTVVINDTVVNVSPRSPEKFKSVICQAFNVEPEECSQTLFEEAFAPGFGGDTSSAEGSCQ